MSQAITAAFDKTLHDLVAKEGSLTHDDLLRLYGPASKVPMPPVSLSQVKYFADFASDPAVVNAQYKRERDEAERTHGRDYVWEILRTNKHHKWRKQRQFDCRLTDAETAQLSQHGLMVSERLGAKSFADVYYKLYTDDLPVYVTSDSVLHAWHFSFDTFLMDLEMDELMPLLGATLSKTLAACHTQYDAALAAGHDAALAPLAEVELFFAVAHRLLLKADGASATEEQPADDEPFFGEYHRRREQEADALHEASLGERLPLRAAANENRLTALLDAVARKQLTRTTVLGSERDVDFSLFTPRGHYVKTDKLRRFFLAMTWLGTVDFRVDGGANDEENLFQLQCACLAVHVLRQANALQAVETIHETIASLAGDGVGADSMTPRQLHELLGKDTDLLAACVGTNAGTYLRSLQDEIANRGLGAQAIAGHVLIAPLAGQPSRPPTAFAFLGQQFVWSAFAFSKLVFDQVISDDGTKVVRRVPSGVDAAFALLGNDAASSVLAQRMAASAETSDFVKFRDGLPYTPSLIAARRLIDDKLRQADASTSSVALLWQLALRELSAPSANAAPVFQSDVWQKRQMNTQLASLTQLRHDTILYAKQGATFSTCCEYPAGYVDPYPSFWRAMHTLATRTLAIVETVQRATAQVRGAANRDRETKIQWMARPWLTSVIHVTQMLLDISTAQSKQQELSAEQVEFLKCVMEESHGSGASRFLGWYPSLFYTKREDSAKRDVLVADVHTDTPSVEHGDDGGVLHMGVGDVNFAMVVVDDALYAGPVFSHYELITPINERLTDAEFSKRLPSLRAPHWARESFLVTK